MKYTDDYRTGSAHEWDHQSQPTKGAQRLGVVVWTDGVKSSTVSGQIQDSVTWGERVSDPVYAYLNLKVSYGEPKS